MKRTASLLMVIVLVVGSFAAIPASGAFASTPTGTDMAGSQTTTASNNASSESNASIAPGAHFSGAVGVHGAELRGDVESRKFGIRIAEANTADAKAGIVAGQLNESQQRVERLQQRLAELKQARQNGTISQGEFAARVSEIHAELNTVQHMANRSADVARGLPEETLQANGVNVSAIEQLRERASNLSGPEVAAIARTIAGPNAGERPGKAGNRSANADGGVGAEAGAGNSPTAGAGGQTNDPPRSESANQTVGGEAKVSVSATPDSQAD